MSCEAGLPTTAEMVEMLKQKLASSGNATTSSELTKVADDFVSVFHRPELFRLIRDEFDRRIANDDNDDMAIGNCDWVLSIRDKPKLYSLVFKSAAATSTSLRALTRARAKTGAGEDVADADAQAFCKAAASFRSKL
jgi:hypothetical protein